MEFIVSLFVVVSNFFAGIFGTSVPPQAPDMVQEPKEMIVTPVASSTEDVSVSSKEQKKSVIKTPVASPSSTANTLPQTATSTLSISTSTPSSVATSTAVVTKKKSSSIGSKSSTGIGLSISVENISKLQEGDTRILTVTATLSDKTTKDVTNESTFSIIGDVGSMSGATFTAALSPLVAEYGKGIGAIVATWKTPEGEDVSAQTSVFEVRAYVPPSPSSSGQ